MPIYKCVVKSFIWNECLYEWQDDGFFECDCAGLFLGSSLNDVTDIKVAIIEIKEGEKQ